MRVLLIEDDQALQQLAAEVLADEGHEVTAVASYSEGQRQARSGKWDVIVADMPEGAPYEEIGISGQKAIDRLSKCAPVVICSARPWLRAALPGDLGAVAIVTKPYEVDELVSVVRQAGRPRG